MHALLSDRSLLLCIVGRASPTICHCGSQWKRVSLQRPDDGSSGQFVSNRVKNFSDRSDTIVLTFLSYFGPF